MRLLWRIWCSRWGVLRLAIAAFILTVLVTDTGARLARIELAHLPNYDYLAEVRRLCSSDQFGEALVIADEGLEQTTGPARAALEQERAIALAAQQSWFRRGKDVLKGVVTGAGPDASLEQLIGAVGADFFVIGDIRDLSIQAWCYVREGEADGVIVALSAIGLVTTLAPEIEWAPNVLKAARRAGAMSRRFGEVLVDAVKARNVRVLETVVADTAAIARKSSPGLTARILRLADEPRDLARLAGFVEREGRAGAVALRTTGQSGARVIREAQDLRAAGRVEQATRAEQLVVRAARKGEPGAAWLKRGSYRVLLRSHPVVGVAKALWSGHAAAFIERAIERLDPHALWAIPVLAGWLVFEIGVLLRRFIPSYEPRSRRSPTPA